MTFPNNADSIQNETAPQRLGFTPHQLVRRQVEELDYHVTDEDMANMKISAELPKEEEIEAEEDADVWKPIKPVLPTKYWIDGSVAKEEKYRKNWLIKKPPQHEAAFLC